MTGFGLLSKGHLLVLPGHHTAQETFGLFADALAALAVGHAAGVLFLAVLAKANLPYDALEEVADIVMQGS